MRFLPILLLLSHITFCQNIPARFKKTVVFLSTTTTDSDSLLSGTGFLLLDTAYGAAFGYLTTAHHVIVDTVTKQLFPVIRIRYNRIDGSSNSALIPLRDRGPNKNVFTHPDPSVDIAVIPMIIDEEKADSRYCFISELFKSKLDFDTSYIKEGTNVFYTGLFNAYPGYKQNSPIIRFGKVALLPHEKVLFDKKEPKADLLLAETTTFGGNSGSPAFAYGSVYSINSHEPDDPVNTKEQNHVSIYLLGIIKGYYGETSRVDFNNTAVHPTYGTNIGITAIIPSYLLYEIVEGQELKAFRKHFLNK